MRSATDDARVVTLTATAGTRFGLVGGIYLEPTLEGAVNLAPVRVESTGGGSTRCPLSRAERIVGAWYLGSGPNEFDFTSSLELTAAGEMFLLVDDGNGGLGRQAGLDHQYAWSLNGKNAIFPGPMIPELETAPRRMRIGMVGP